MNTKNLSRRLQAIAQEIPTEAKLIDVGTDHGYLPIHLVKDNKIRGAIASDVNQAPLKSAEEKINREHLHNKIETRYGKGLSVITTEDNIDTVVVAGMGGPLITSILNEGSQALQFVNKLILQPNVRAEDIRMWLFENNWILIKELILEEDEKVYEILTAEPGNGTIPYSAESDVRKAELLFGPYLMRKQNLAFTRKWEREMKQWKAILAEIEKAENKKDVSEKKIELEGKIKLVEEVIQDETS